MSEVSQSAPHKQAVIDYIIDHASEALYVEKIAEETLLKKRTVSRVCCRLTFEGILERTAIGCYSLTAYGHDHLVMRGYSARSGPVVNAQLREKPRKPKRNNLRVRAWRAMRMKNKFTINDLISVAANGEEKDPRGNLGIYLTQLQRCGVIRRLPRRVRRPREGGDGSYRYVLTNDLGPQAPIIRKNGVYDQNSEDMLEFAQ